MAQQCETPRNGWFRAQVTVQNLVFLAMLLVAVVGWVRDRQYEDTALQGRLAAVEAQVSRDRLHSEDTYVRRDVLMEQLAAISARLGRIEEDLKRLR